MNMQHNDSLSLDWLMPLFKEQLASLSSDWQRYQDGQKSAIVPDMAQDYHQISGALSLANLPVFAELAEALSALTLHLSSLVTDEAINKPATTNHEQQLQDDLETMVHMAVKSHELLVSELKQFGASSNYHQQLLSTSSDEIANILMPDAEVVYSQFSQLTNSPLSNEYLSDMIELPVIAAEKLNLSLEQKQKIKQAWYFHQGRLIEEDRNSSKSVEQMYKMSQFVWRSCAGKLEQRTWYLACLWLGNIPKNHIPKPQQYGRVINNLYEILSQSLRFNDHGELDEKLELTPKEETTYESVIAELFIQIKLLKNIDSETQQVIDRLYSGSVESDEFFTRILKQLEQLIFQLHEPKKVIEPLIAIKQQLDRRGWGIYVTYLEVVLDELEFGLDTPEIYAETQWQVERQMQEVYGSIFAMKQNIGDKVSHTENFESNDINTPSQALRQVRIAIEEIKGDFNQYISSNDLNRLPKPEAFENISSTLAEMELTQANEVLEKLFNLFNRYHENELDEVSWTIIGVTADSIAEFELFLDHLAQQILDIDRLDKASERIEQANIQIDQFLAGPQSIFDDVETLVDDNVIRYDDNGEIQPDDIQIDDSELLFDDLEITQSTSESSHEQEANTTSRVIKGTVAVVDGTAAVSHMVSDTENTDKLISDKIESDDDSNLITDENNTDIVVVDTEALKEARKILPEDDFSMDEDIQEIFIEEAEEVLQEMDEHLPVWQHNPEDLDSLKEIRRGFHTLKGSGRMVGAHNVGEMSWAVENMLNRVLDNTLPVTEELVGFINETKNCIPILVDDYANKRKPSTDPAITVLKANNLLAKRDINEGIPSELLTEIGSMSVDMVETGTILEASELLDDVSTIEETVEKQQVQEQDEIIKPMPVAEFAIPEVLSDYWGQALETPADTADADEDIKEIFIEEAEEVLETITPLYAEWIEEKSDIDKLTDIRRGFHTLKGSGRMVGANYTAELAWAIENMLNRVLDHTVTVEPEMVSLIQDVLEAYPELIDSYDEGNNEYPEVIPLWITCATAYSKGLADQFSYHELLVSLLAEDVQEVTDATDVEDSLEEPSANMVVDISAASISNAPVTESESEISTATEITEEERELIDIFLEEAKERLEVIEHFVEKNQGADEAEVSDDLVRAFHTLKGSSRAESLHAISDVSKTIEENLSLLQQNESSMTSQHIDAVAQASKFISEHLTAYENSLEADELVVVETDESIKVIQTLITDSTVEQEKLSTTPTLDVASMVDEQIDELLDAEWELDQNLKGNNEQSIQYASLLASQIGILIERTQSSKSFQKLLNPMLNAYQRVANEPELTNDESVLLTLLSGHEQLSSLFDSLAGNMSLNVDEQVVQKLSDIGDEHIGTDNKPTESIENTDIATESSETETIELESSNDLLDEVNDSDNEIIEEIDDVATEAELVVADPVEFEVVTTDPELLEIFLEEAQELDAEISQSFFAWRKNPSDTHALKELQRHLHTIKGGARMAGISSIGDLTHEMESIYEAFVNEEMTPSRPWLNVMQNAQDTLSMQVEQVVESQRSFYTVEMIEQIRDYAQLDELPEDARLTIPVIAVEVEEEDISETVKESNENEQLDEVVINFNKMVKASWESEQPDEDILEVYLEEAEELIESSSQNLQMFRSNTGSIRYLQALQRELHTIKGGARMVNANGIADISHEMETVYEELGSRRLPATKMVLELLASCHDWVASSVYLLQHKINPPMPASFIQALKDFHRNPDNLKEVPKLSLKEYTDAIFEYEAHLRTLKGEHDISEMPPMSGSFGEFEDKTDISSEQIRVSSGLMEQMINLSGESAINRARIDMGMSSLTNSIEEMGTTVQRLADQLRRMDIELEAQVIAQIDDAELLESADFDPLEMDQYSSLNQLSKSLSESASDLLDIKTTLLEKTRDSENLLLQLSRTQAELQDGLMSSRMVPFSRLTPRLQRVVRQTANEVGKEVDLTIANADDEMDRTILERITSPLEHMLRNAVDHGVESANERERMGKDRMGQINLSIQREGGEMVIHLSDDGSGIDVHSVRKKAISQGLIDPNDDTLTDTDIMQYIFNAGLSTTKKVTQISGRGVGMDVVRSEIRQLGGTVSVESARGKGSRFTMRVPLTVAVSDALVVRAADRHYVIPLVQIERVEQVNREELFAYYQSDKHTFNMQGVDYRLRYLNEILTGNTINDLASSNNSLPIIVIKNQTGQNLALQVDEIVGSRIEVVIKPLGKQLSHLSGVSAATIMGDGSVMLILDLMALMRNAPVRKITKAIKPKAIDIRKKVLVIDDSVTVRKVTSRFLEREGFDAHVAKDGVDALEILQEFTPDLILLDIEMPRMDGFEVATQVRNTQRLTQTPIIMITSRTGDKHRERAMEIGVNDYLGKPFQENVLLERISGLLDLQMSQDVERKDG